jgi:CxxC motif-containing protein (DUF1111 family)
MGSLGDGITQNSATGQLIRTQPLWGLRFSVKTGLLHDGTANTITDAIEAHDGQAEDAREAFDCLSHDDRQALLDFLETL